MNSALSRTRKYAHQKIKEMVVTILKKRKDREELEKIDILKRR